MRHGMTTALGLVLGLAAIPALAQSDKAGEPKASAAVTGCIQAGAQVSAEAFDALDSDGDGFIAQQEYIEACGKANAAADDAAAEGQEAAKAHFASLDANRDQKLTQDEFKSPAVKRSDAAGTSGSKAAAPAQKRADAQGSAGSTATKASRASGADGSAASSTSGSTSSGAMGASAPGGEKALAGVQADEVIGMNVVNAKGDEIGEVKDLVLDDQQIAHAVVSVGGFLGIGAKDVAVPFDQLRVGPESVILMSETSESELKQMPEYEKDRYSPVQREESPKAAPAQQRKQ